MVEHCDVARRWVGYDGTAYRQLILRWGKAVPGPALMVAVWAVMRPDRSIDEGTIRIHGGGA